jgi:hypothetical protein
MQAITNLSDEADQLASVILADGSVAAFEFIYRPAIERWLFSLTHPTLAVNLINLCMGPNVLRDWRNVIAFGLACLTTDGADPFYIEDFASGRVTLYVLDASEVAGVETTIFGPGVVAA